METREGVVRQYNLTAERVFGGYSIRGSYRGARGSGMNYSLDIKPLASPTPFSAPRLPYPQFASSYVTRSDGDGDTKPRSSRCRSGPAP